MRVGICRESKARDVVFGSEAYVLLFRLLYEKINKFGGGAGCWGLTNRGGTGVRENKPEEDGFACTVTKSDD